MCQCTLQAHNLIGEIEDPQLTLQYKACYARICDCKRKFLEAATHYYDLSQSGPGVQCALQTLSCPCSLLHGAYGCCHGPPVVKRLGAVRCDMLGHN